MWVDPYTSRKVVADALENQKQVEEYRKEYNLTPEDTANEASFADRVSTAFDLTRYQMADTYNEKLSDEIAKSRDEYHKLTNTLNVQKGYEQSLLGTTGVRNMSIDKWKDNTKEIERLRQINPEFNNVKTYDEIRAGLAKEFLDIQIKDQVQTENSNYAGMFGFAVGSIGGYFTSPVNAATALIPVAGIEASTAAALFKSGLRLAAQEQVISAGQFLRDEPYSVKIREEATGQPVTLDEQLKELAIQQGITAAASVALVGGVGLYGALRGKYSSVGNAALNKDRGPVTAEMQDNLNTANIPEEEKNVIQDTIDVAKTTPEGIDQMQHARNYEAMAKSFVTGEEPNLPFAKPDPLVEDLPKTPDVGTQAEIYKSFEPTDFEKSVKEKYNKMDSYLSTLDQESIIPDRVTPDGEIESSHSIKDLRRRLREYEDDNNAISQIFDCWIGGGPKGG